MLIQQKVSYWRKQKPVQPVPVTIYETIMTGCVAHNIGAARKLGPHWLCAAGTIELMESQRDFITLSPLKKKWFAWECCRTCLVIEYTAKAVVGSRERERVNSSGLWAVYTDQRTPGSSSLRCCWTRATVWCYVGGIISHWQMICQGILRLLYNRRTPFLWRLRPKSSAAAKRCASLSPSTFHRSTIFEWKKKRKEMDDVWTLIFSVGQATGALFSFFTFHSIFIILVYYSLICIEMFLFCLQSARLLKCAKQLGSKMSAQR